jgi:TPR repeat protein
VKNSKPSPAPVEAKSPPLVPIIAAARLIGPNQARIDGLLSQAAQRIESGDVAGAREMLAGADDGGQGAVSFALAETYDPNMLAAWGTRGVAADAAKARALYRKAFDLGVARAQNRLDALRP